MWVRVPPSHLTYINEDTLSKTERRYKRQKTIYRAEEESSGIERDVVNKICNYQNCNKEYYIPISELERGRGKYCSRSCAAKDNVQGENNPNYKDGREKSKKKWYEEIKSTSRCEKCGESYDECLSFHHRNPENKVDTLSNMITKDYTLEEVKEESRKCDILCANCHIKLHNKS